MTVVIVIELMLMTFEVQVSLIHSYLEGCRRIYSVSYLYPYLHKELRPQAPESYSQGNHYYHQLSENTLGSLDVSTNVKSYIAIPINSEDSSFLLCKGLEEKVISYYLYAIQPRYNCIMVIIGMRSVVSAIQSLLVFFLLRLNNSTVNPLLPKVESIHYSSEVQGLQNLVCYCIHFIWVSYCLIHSLYLHKYL